MVSTLHTPDVGSRLNQEDTGGGGGGAIIASIQEGTIILGSGETSDTVTISSVDTGVSVLHYSGVTSDSAGSGELDHTLSRVALTNATTVTVNRAVALVAQVTVGFTVVEYDSSIIQSVQTGSITLSGATTGTDTIAAVDTAKSTVLFNGNEGTAATEIGRIVMRVTLTNATTVTANKGQANNSATVNYTVIEYK